VLKGRENEFTKTNQPDSCQSEDKNGKWKSPRIKLAGWLYLPHTLAKIWLLFGNTSFLCDLEYFFTVLF
jgi:hypothetical protein